MAALAVLEIRRQESELVRAAKRGDGDAFGILFQGHWRRLTASVRRIVRDHHLAEDVAQETFLRAHASLWRLDDAENFGSWLRRIARNIAVDRVRADHARPVTELAEPALVPELPCDDGMLAARRQRVDRRQSGILWTAIARLSKRDRKVLLLRFARGISYREIARECGMTLAMTKVTIHRAKERLFADLADTAAA